MTKIKINMLSNADRINGQGVGSAYLEQVNLIKNELSDYFDVVINDKHKADIIHCHTLLPRYLFQMKINPNINVVYVHFLPHTLNGSIHLPKFSFYLFKKYVIYFYKSADYLIVVNPSFIPELMSLGIQKEKIYYIPNYVSQNSFFIQSTHTINQTKQKYHINPNSFVVLSVGQVQTRKGVKDFIEVANALPHITFVWAGGFSFGKITDGYNELQELYQSPPPNVRFLGIIQRQDMNDIYNMCDIFFMPSYNELFPMSILEAVNTKKPLLLRNLSLYKDILFDNYLYGTNNNEFINLIKQLQSDSQLYHQYSQYSYNLSQYYSKEHIKKIWKDFYLKIIETNQYSK